MSKVKKQHYVPQFYLRNFFSKSEKLINAIYVNRFKFLKDISIKKQCYEKYYYDNDNSVEKKLGKIESNAQPIIQKMITEGNLPKVNSKNHFDLFLFIMSLMGRTKSKDLESQNTGKKFLEKILEIHFGCLGDQSFLQHIKVDMNKMVIENLSNFLNHLPLIFDLNFCLIKNNTEIDFITSDNPIVLTNSLYSKHNTTGSLGVVSRGLQIFLPLNKKNLLYLYDRNVYEPIDIINSDININYINRMQFLNCNNCVYFSKDEQSKLLLKECKVVEKERNTDTCNMNEFKNSENNFTLIHSFKSDLISPISEKFSIYKDGAKKKYSENKPYNVRNPEMVENFELFRELVKQKVYKDTDFIYFLKKKYPD